MIPRAAIEEEEAEEEEEDDGQVAIEADEVETLSPSGTLESDSVETIAAVVSEDPGASAGSEEEEEDQGAYDPKTGTINWDCPCLGGMAHGPCGEHFKAAFSCFIYSEGEPKGIECVDKFKAMQDCFRAHPEVYSEELEMDEQVSDSQPIRDVRFFEDLLTHQPPPLPRTSSSHSSRRRRRLWASSV